MTKPNPFFYLLLLLSFASCSNDNIQENFDYGNVINNKYQNLFFDFEMDIPDNWNAVVQNQEDDQLEQDQENDKSEEIVRVTEIDLANLIMIFKYKDGSDVEFNPSIIVVAERINNPSTVQTEADYLKASADYLKKSKTHYDHIDDSFEKIEINGSTFSIMNVFSNAPTLKIEQNHYTLIKNGFALTFILNSSNNEQKTELEKIIQSVNFE